TNLLAQSGKGTYTFDTEWLCREKPDLILTQDLCHVCDLDASEVVKAIASLQPPPEVLVLSPKNLADIMNNIKRVGEATGVMEKADLLYTRLQSRIDAVADRAASAEHKPRVFMLEWIDPLAAGGHWFPELVALAGGKDELGKPGDPSVLLAWKQVLKYNPEIILMSPCSCAIGRTLRDVHLLARQEGWWDIEAVRRGQVYIVVPDYYTRPGPRIVRGLEITAQILHPESFTDLIPAQTVVKLDPLARDNGSPEGLAQYFHPYP
ncbi:ABC transporter substrate-binding protein, partial [Acidobacteria bacterium AH-259-D05]|nr:ABC transporter substrate-binding protein [Acidobacteria bacterium AH-259-D05]